MNTLYIDGVLSVDMLKTVASFITYVGPKTLYMSLDGGSIGLARTLLDMINHTDDLTIVGTDRLYSAGLYVYTYCERPKRLVDGTRGMWHQGVYEVEINTDGKPTYISDKFNLSIHTRHHNDIILALAKKLSFTDREVKHIEKGKDVYFSYERMKEMFPDVLQNFIP